MTHDFGLYKATGEVRRGALFITWSLREPVRMSDHLLPGSRIWAEKRFRAVSQTPDDGVILATFSCDASERKQHRIFLMRLVSRCSRSYGVTRRAGGYSNW
jgi:hypothetical protein